MKGDLHCHTRASDGSLTPAELVRYAARTGVRCIAVTDHDHMAGVAEAQTEGKACGVAVVPGIEVSTLDGRSGRKAHLLCYRPARPEAMLGMCAATLRRRHEASLRILKKLSARYPIDEAVAARYASTDRPGGGTIYKQHIMAALMDMGYDTALYGRLYGELLASGKGWAWEEPAYPDTREAMRVIAQAGGVPVLAHPGLYGNFDLVEELCTMGLKGIEVSHPRQSAEASERAEKLAERYGLLRTGGSDFHGRYASAPAPLGAGLAQDEAVLLLTAGGGPAGDA